MRLALSIGSNDFGAAEAERKREIYTQREREIRATTWKNRKTSIFTSIKRGLSLLFMMTVVSLAYLHRDDLEHIISQRLNHVVAARAHSPTALRQAAFNHEQEIDQIVQ